MTAHRLLEEDMSKYQSNVFTYRFDELEVNSSTTVGVRHFAEVCSHLKSPLCLRKSSPELHSFASRRGRSIVEPPSEAWTAYGEDVGIFCF